MSHVDDGLIHAWLDGALRPGDPERVALEAHLSECDECRARVDAERRIRDRATEVLRAAAPDAVRVEPFEPMIAARLAALAAAEAAAASAAEPETVPGRVESTTPIAEAPSRRRRRYVPLAWAASLALAVSAGWFARAYLPEPVMQEGTETLARDAALEGDAVQPPAASLEAPAGPPAPAGAQRVAGGEAAVPGARSTARRDDEAGRMTTGGLAAAKTEEETRAANQAVAGQVRRPTEETKRLADAMVLDTARAQEAMQKAAAPPAAAFAVTEVGADAAVTAALATYRTAGWETVTEAEATARLGKAPSRIEGVAIDSLQAVRHEGVWLIRVLQPIGPGASAEILQWPEALNLEAVVVTGAVAGEQRNAAARRVVSADSVARLRERQAAVSALVAPRPAAPVSDRPALQLRSPGFRLLLRADVGADSLSALAARIR